VVTLKKTIAHHEIEFTITPEAQFNVQTGEFEAVYNVSAPKLGSASKVRLTSVQGKDVLEVSCYSELGKNLSKLLGKKKSYIYITLPEAELKILKKAGEALVKEEASRAKNDLREKLEDADSLIFVKTGRFSYIYPAKQREEIPLTVAEKSLFEKEIHDVKRFLMSKKEKELESLGELLERHWDDYSITEKWLFSRRRLEKTYYQTKATVAKQRVAELEQKISELRSLSPEHLVRRYFTEAIHITEDGCFSNCPSYCDDCFWVDIWSKDTPEDVRVAAPILEVRNSESGRTYIYRRVDERSLTLFLERHSSLLEVQRDKELTRFEKDLKDLEKELNSLPIPKNSKE